MTRLLLIEDDPQLSQVLEISLQRQGYEVVMRTNGLQGYELAKANDYDGIVMDWTLPGMSGIEICKELRDAGDETPIIMLTGRSAHKDRINGLDTGADDYLTKPFSAEELYARLRAVLRRNDPKTGRLQIADLVLSDVTYEVSRAGLEIRLMPKEFDLLRYLMQHPGVALSRNDIVKAVWNIDAKHSSNRLDVYIRHLRQKIDENHSVKLLQTVRGHGYRISG